MFTRAFNNSADHLQRLYGQWEHASVFITVTDNSEIVAVARLVAPNPLGGPTVAELERVWQVDAGEQLATIGMAADAVWDFATLASAGTPVGRCGSCCAARTNSPRMSARM